MDEKLSLRRIFSPPVLNPEYRTKKHKSLYQPVNKSCDSSKMEVENRQELNSSNNTHPVNEEVENRQEPTNNNDHPVDEEGGKWELSKYLEHQGKWLEQARGNLMVVATVLATISFQVAINPPGGVWQQDDGCGPTGDNCTRIAGTSVLENSKFGSKDAIFHDLLTNCIVSFTFSMATVYFLLLGVSLRSKLVTFVIFFMMSYAVGSTVQAFKLSVRLVHSDNSSIRSRMLIYDWFWLVISVVIPVVYGVLYCAMSCFRKRSNRRSRPSGQSASSTA